MSKISTLSNVNINVLNSTLINPITPNKMGNILTEIINLIPDGGLSNANIVEKTRDEVHVLMTENSLIPGTLYKITGFYKNKTAGSYPMASVLYDDGNNLGTTIYLLAITNNSLSSSGYGEFYNPAYYDITTYNELNGYGLYGIWDGDNPDISKIPTYQINQVCFWGNYAWRNKTGNIGGAIDICNLDPTNWEKLPYSNPNYYDKVIDIIEVDYLRDYMTGRKNIENNIEVISSSSLQMWNIGTTNFHPISVMAWGLYSRIADLDEGGTNGLDNEIGGLYNVSVINSYAETVSFKGVGFYDVEVHSSSEVYNNYFGKSTYFSQNYLKNWSRFKGNVMNENSNIYENILNSSRMIDNILSYNSYIQSNVLNESYITSNTSFSFIERNTLGIGSSIDSNNVNIISYNTLSDSYIQGNFGPGGINYNYLTKSYISYVNMPSYFEKNTLSNSTININNVMSVNISYLDASNVYVSGDYSTFSALYLSNVRYMYSRPDGGIRIRYYGNNDSLVVESMSVPTAVL
jgi:hypothetical protein